MVDISKEAIELYWQRKNPGMDQALALSLAIQAVDPNLDNAFTPEAAEEAFREEQGNDRRKR